MASNISSTVGKSHRWARVFAGFVAAGTLGMGLGLFSAPIAGADTPAPIPVPAPAAPGAPAAGNQMGNAFLHMLSSMIGKVVPGAEQIIPANLPEPGAPAPAVPGLTGAPGATAPAPAAHIGQTIA